MKLNFIKKILYKISYLKRYLKRNAFVFGEGKTLPKIINFFLIEIQDYLNILHVFGKPYSIFIDPVNICPLSCPLCGIGLKQHPRNKHKMEMNEFKRYVKSLESSLYLIKFYNYGEPFLNSELPEMISYAKKKKISLQVNSNLNVLTYDYAKRIVESGLDTLVVSFDGLTQESYSAYRKGGDINIVKKNIDIINEIKEKSGKNNPKIILQFLITKYNESEYDKVKEYAKKINAEFFPSPITLDVNNKEQREKWLPENESYCRYDMKKTKKIKTKPDKKCGFLWNDVVINVDGGIAPCCHLFYKSMDYGNLNDNTFNEIWNNKMFVNSRKIFRTHKTPKDSFACARCINTNAFGDIDQDLINENATNNLK